MPAVLVRFRTSGIGGPKIAPPVTPEFPRSPPGTQLLPGSSSRTRLSSTDPSWLWDDRPGPALRSRGP
jgi:hypothetical protein